MSLKCPDCGCLFFHKSDLEKHLNAFGKDHKEMYEKLHRRVELNLEIYDVKKTDNIWKVGKYGGWWCFAYQDKELATLCKKHNGKVVLGEYIITLDRTEKYLNKRLA